MPLFKGLFIETNPMPVKAALARMGLIGNVLRLPLTPMQPDKFVQLERVLEQLGLLSTVRV
jgi:4-hydroxy-tetrahydrodipicolinate synthase